MKIILNGKTADISSKNLAELIVSQGLQESRVVIEYNGEIVHRNLWESTSLQDGDHVEIVGFMGGG